MSHREAHHTNLVYHASDRQGLTCFVPRRYWRNADYSSSGNLDDGREPPVGMIVFSAFYASDWEFLPFYFVPPGVGRIQLCRGKHAQFDEALNLLGITKVDADRVLVIAEQDRPRLLSHRFSIYAFDESAFPRVPTGEYVADAPVSPLEETVHENALAAITERGIQVTYTDDLARCFQVLRENNILFDSQGYA